MHTHRYTSLILPLLAKDTNSLPGTFPRWLYPVRTKETGNWTSAYREGNATLESFAATSSEESRFWMNLKKMADFTSGYFSGHHTLKEGQRSLGTFDGVSSKFLQQNWAAIIQFVDGRIKSTNWLVLISQSQCEHTDGCLQGRSIQPSHISCFQCCEGIESLWHHLHFPFPLSAQIFPLRESFYNIPHSP